MIKEIKYLFYIISICIFFYVIANYYFSDSYEKKSYRAIINFKKDMQKSSIELPLIRNDTNNIVKYKNHTNTQINKKKRKFFDLIK